MTTTTKTKEGRINDRIDEAFWNLYLGGYSCCLESGSADGVDLTWGAIIDVPSGSTLPNELRKVADGFRDDLRAVADKIEKIIAEEDGRETPQQLQARMGSRYGDIFAHTKLADLGKSGALAELSKFKASPTPGLDKEYIDGFVQQATEVLQSA